MKKFFLLGLAALSALASSADASIVDDAYATEQIGLSMRGLKICHQNDWRNMAVYLSYNSDVDGGARDVRRVRDHVRLFLEKYPNTKDFWEVMNVKLVRSLTEEFPDMEKIESHISLTPDSSLVFPRESTVEYEVDADHLKESFGFTKLNYLICNESFQSLDLRIDWVMQENPADLDYPDYQFVNAAMEEFFAEYPVSFSSWNTLKPQLESYLLERFPTLQSIEVQVTLAT